MLTDEPHELESKDDESLGTQEMLPLLLDTPETALLLDETVALGDIKKLGELILLQKANINNQYLYTNHTSLLATAVMNKRVKIVEWLLLLQLNYVITTADIEEIKDLIKELKKIKESGELNEENTTALKAGLAVLRTLKEEIKDQHFKKIREQTAVSDIKAEIDAAIIALSPPSTTVSTTNNTINTTATATVATPSPLLHAFQDVKAIVTELSALMAKPDFDSFSRLLTFSIQQNPMFNINALDKEGEEGKTLLHHATVTSDDRFLKILLENKANPNVGDRRDWTPVHCAAFTGKHFKVLIEGSVFTPIQWDLKTKKGETILDLAKKGQALGLNKFSEEDLEVIRLKCANTAKLTSLV